MLTKVVMGEAGRAEMFNPSMINMISHPPTAEPGHTLAIPTEGHTINLKKNRNTNLRREKRQVDQSQDSHLLAMETINPNQSHQIMQETMDPLIISKVTINPPGDMTMKMKYPSR